MTQQPLEFVAGEIQLQIQERIRDLHKRGSLSSMQTFILGEMITHGSWSRDRAMSIGDILGIADAGGPNSLTPRSVKLAVKQLIEEHRVPIGSWRKQPSPGYFFITSDEDAEIAASSLQADIMSLFRRVRILAPRSAFVRKLNGQMEMIEEGSGGG